MDSLVNYLYSFNDTTFSEWMSIPGPIVNGAETYLDSVFLFENKLLNKFGGVSALNNEDSIYTFYVPTNEAWNKMIAQAEKHFNYVITPSIVDSALVDSLRNYHPRFNIIKYLTYSESEQIYVKDKDSIMPAQNQGQRKRFARADVEKYVVETKELSNGTMKIVNEFPYSVFDLWHDTIRLEAEALSYVNKDLTIDKNWITTYTVSDKDINKKAGKKLSGSQYIVLGDEANSSTDLYYYIPNVRSATYQVALITVPKNIKSDKVDLSEEPTNPLRCNIYSYDPVTKDVSYELLAVKDLLPKADKIDTLYLPELVTFPVCEYNVVNDVDDYTAQIRIRSTVGKKYDHSIRLDAILLIPVEDAE